MKVIEKIAEANSFQRSTVQKVSQQAEESTRGQVVRIHTLHEKAHTNKVIKAFKKYDVSVGINNNPSATTT
jgi:hypothetical protein